MEVDMLDHIEVRYDGKEAKTHIISASELGESLQGFSKIFGAAYHFSTTGEFVSKAPAQNVRVYVTTPEAKCYQVWFDIWELAKQQQVFQGLVGNVAVAVVTYIVARAADRHTESPRVSWRPVGLSQADTAA